MELFEIIEDDYKEMNRKYKEIFGYDMSSKDELKLSFKKNKNIVRTDKLGAIEGFLNYADNGTWYDFKTIAIRRDLRGSFYGGKLAVSMFNEMIERARNEGVLYIDLVLLTLEGTILAMAKRMGFVNTSFLIDQSRILLRKEILK